MRKTHLAALAGALLTILLAARVAFDVDRYRGSVQAAVAAQLGRAVSFGHLSATLTPFGVRAERVTIAEDPAFRTNRPFAQADAVDVRLEPFALLRGRVDVRGVTLRSPVIELVRGSGGAWNVASLVREGVVQNLALDRLAVTDGRIAVTDAGRRVVYRIVSADLLHFGAGRAADLAAVMALPDDGVVSVTATLETEPGCLSARGDLRLEQARVHGTEPGHPVTGAFDAALEPDSGTLTIRSATLRLGQVPMTVDGTVLLRSDTPTLDVHVVTSDASLTEAARLAPAFGVGLTADGRIEGRLSADLRATGPTNRLSLSGHARLRDVIVSGAALPRPVRTPAIDLALTPDAIRSNDFQAITNGTSVTARFTLGRYTTPKPSIEAGVRAAGANLADVLNILRAWRVPGADLVSGAGRVTLDVRVAGAIDDPVFSGTASVDEMTVKTAAGAPPLQVRRADLAFGGDGSTRVRAAAISSGSLVVDNAQTTVTRHDGVVRFDPLVSGLYGGRQRGSVTVDTRRTPVAIAVSSEIQGVDANRFASAAFDIKDVIYGSLASVLRLSFSGSSPIARTLDGTVAFNVSNGRLAHVDVLHEVRTIARFLAGKPGAASSTSVMALSGSLNITDGVASTNRLLATIEGGRIGGAGSLDLVSQALNMRVNVVLSRSFSRTLAGPSPDGLMRTVLANERGELVVPMFVTGTLQRPLFAPDPEAVAEMQVRKLVPNLGDPQGFATGLLGILGGAANDRGAPAAAKPGSKDSNRQLDDLLLKMLGEVDKATKKAPPRPPKKRK